MLLGLVGDHQSRMLQLMGLKSARPWPFHQFPDCASQLAVDAGVVISVLGYGVENIYGLLDYNRFRWQRARRLESALNYLRCFAACLKFETPKRTYALCPH
jgi:hypothetical protein